MQGIFSPLLKWSKLKTDDTNYDKDTEQAELSNGTTTLEN